MTTQPSTHSGLVKYSFSYSIGRASLVRSIHSLTENT